MMSVVLLLALAAVVSGQYDYQKKGYVPPALSGATTCVKQPVGNTPANCPVSAGVPLTDEGKPGSTVCFTQYSTGKSYEGVFSLTYPSTAVPGCTSDSDCGTTPGVLCGTNAIAGVGIPNTCFPLAPSGCPFTGDTVNSTSTSSAGRKFAL